MGENLTRKIICNMTCK